MVISSKENNIIKYTAKLSKSSKFRKEQKSFAAEGVRICRDGVDSGKFAEYFFYTADAKEKYGEDFNKISSCSKIVCEVSQSVFEKISDTKTPQGFLCVFNMLDKIKKPYTINIRGRYVALENLQDPSNVGTVLRTAEALGMDGVIMSRDCCDVYSPKVVRGSMGAVFRLPLNVVDNLAEYIQELSLQGIASYGSTPRNAEPINSIDCTCGVMLIGNEGNGLTENTLSVCTKRVMIPMFGRAESLNASAAAAILMWEMFR